MTGAGSGIGKAVALALLKEGYSVVLAGRRPDPLEQAVDEAGSAADALVVTADVSDPESVRALFARTKDSVSAGSTSSSTTPGSTFPACRSRT